MNAHRGAVLLVITVLLVLSSCGKTAGNMVQSSLQSQQAGAPGAPPECTGLQPPPQSVDPYPYLSVSYFAQSCPTGWQAFSEARGRFIAGVTGNAAAGTIYPATPMAGVTDLVHTHSVSPTLTFGQIGLVAEAWAGTTLAASTAVPGTKTTVSGQASGLGMVGLLTCVKCASPPTTGSIPSGVIVFSTQAVCADGWDQVNSAAGRYILALPTGAQPGLAFGGDPFAPGRDIVHAHAVSGTVPLTTRETSNISKQTDGGYAQSGTASYSSQVGNPVLTGTGTSATPPYILLQVCQKN